MTRAELIELADSIARKHNLNPALVKALCHHESNWNPWATKYEPAFQIRYIEPIAHKTLTFGPTISKATEMKDRATSFGLCQVMGQVAREYGFRGEYLSELLTPDLALDYGCQKLARAIRSAEGDVRAGLLRFNGGSDPTYPDKVLAHLQEYS